MAAFNAVAGLNPFTIIAVVTAVVGALRVFLQVSSISLDMEHHGSMGRSIWLVQQSVWAIGQVVSRFVSGVWLVVFEWKPIQPYLSCVVAFLQQ